MPINRHNKPIRTKYTSNYVNNYVEMPWQQINKANEAYNTRAEDNIDDARGFLDTMKESVKDFDKKYYQENVDKLKSYLGEYDPGSPQYAQALNEAKSEYNKFMTTGGGSEIKEAKEQTDKLVAAAEKVPKNAEHASNLTDTYVWHKLFNEKYGNATTIDYNKDGSQYVDFDMGQLLNDSLKLTKIDNSDNWSMQVGNNIRTFTSDEIESLQKELQYDPSGASFVSMIHKTKGISEEMINNYVTNQLMNDKSFENNARLDFLSENAKKHLGYDENGEPVYLNDKREPADYSEFGNVNSDKNFQIYLNKKVQDIALQASKSAFMNVSNTFSSKASGSEVNRQKQEGKSKTVTQDITNAIEQNNEMTSSSAGGFKLAFSGNTNYSGVGDIDAGVLDASGNRTGESDEEISVEELVAATNKVSTDGWEKGIGSINFDQTSNPNILKDLSNFMESYEQGAEDLLHRVNNFAADDTDSAYEKYKTSLGENGDPMSRKDFQKVHAVAKESVRRRKSVLDENMYIIDESSLGDDIKSAYKQQLLREQDKEYLYKDSNLSPQAKEVIELVDSGKLATKTLVDLYGKNAMNGAEMQEETFGGGLELDRSMNTEGENSWYDLDWTDVANDLEEKGYEYGSDKYNAVNELFNKGKKLRDKVNSLSPHDRASISGYVNRNLDNIGSEGMKDSKSKHEAAIYKSGKEYLEKTKEAKESGNKLNSLKFTTYNGINYNNVTETKKETYKGGQLTKTDMVTKPRFDSEKVVKTVRSTISGGTRLSDGNTIDSKIKESWSSMSVDQQTSSGSYEKYYDSELKKITDSSSFVMLGIGDAKPSVKIGGVDYNVNVSIDNNALAFNNLPKQMQIDGFKNEDIMTVANGNGHSERSRVLGDKFSIQLSYKTDEQGKHSYGDKIVYKYNYIDRKGVSRSPVIDESDMNKLYEQQLNKSRGGDIVERHKESGATIVFESMDDYSEYVINNAGYIANGSYKKSKFVGDLVEQGRARIIKPEK